MGALRAEEFYAYMREREAIRLAKEGGLPPPWTRDPILGVYKFTNVKREHDRTTRILRETLYEPNRDAPAHIVLLNAATYRYFGTFEMAQAVGWQKNWSPERLHRIATERMASGERVFTGAYIINSAAAPGPKQDVVVWRHLDGLAYAARRVAEVAARTKSWREAMAAMAAVSGFGGSGFMAKEVLLDTMFCDTFWLTPNRKPIDFNDWCPAGPGARRGARRVTSETSAKGAMSAERALDIMLELFKLRWHHWPQNHVELELHDIQFALCEFDKYERARLGEGRPRSRYTPQKRS
jgi:hypothetical protein